MNDTTDDKLAELKAKMAELGNPVPPGATTATPDGSTWEPMFSPTHIHHLNLSDEQIEFIDLSNNTGPEHEDFVDYYWNHCDNEECEACMKHAVHHGIEHKHHNPDGQMTSIWKQCIDMYGDLDNDGHKLTPSLLLKYYDSQPEKVSTTTQTQTDQTKQKKEKKTMNTIVGSKKRAEIILKALERFDVSWREGGHEGFYNTLRVSPYYLRQFITTMLETLLRKEAIYVFKQEMKLLDIDLNTRNLISEYYDTPSYNRNRDVDGEKQEIIVKLTNKFIQAISDAVDDVMSANGDMGAIHRWGDTMGKGRKGENPREVLQYYLDKAYRGGIMDNPFVKAYLTYDNDEGTTLPLSQKARGIHAIGKSTIGLSLFNKLPSLYISLDAANTSTNRELIMSIARAWTGQRVESTLAKGLYIRTCPATPRPGALPNVKAATPRQFLDGVRMLGECMTNPDHVDYDPEGCLIVQEYILPVCSAVVVKGSSTFTVGPENDGVTAGGGSNITFKLNTRGQRYLKQDIEKLALDDGMEHHEIEMVYSAKSSGRKKTLPWFQRLADARHTGGEGRIKPTITQMRGLHTAKADLVPPPMVGEEALYIRGNVPSGTIEQLESMDVGKGSLDECIELEQMAKKGELPKGFVVYAPSGTNSAHVAGVGLDFNFPVIYGIKPKKNKTVWTEIQGWVTDRPGAEAQPYSPEPFMDFYKIGLRDGDRFWTYNLAPLSQFFHNFISGPVNDPRLEAYLAGVFTSWIIKAALGVSMAEFRHGIGSSRADISMQRAFSHILIQQTIAGESGVNNLFQRSDYYQRLNYNELGYDLIHSMAKFYSDAYDPDVTEWCDGSFGGEKYYNSTYPTRDASSLILSLLQGGAPRITSLLNSVNNLESAVHNTGFFFNKFLGDKSAFDIGTGGHGEFASACEHWLVTAPFYALFYTNYVNEPHRVAKGHEKLIQHLTKMEKQKVNQSMIEEMPKFLSIANWDGTLKKDIHTMTLKHHEHFFVEQLKADFRMHKKGLCGYEECNSGECKKTAALVKMGIDEHELNILLQELNKFMNQTPFSFAGAPQSIEDVTEGLTAQGSRAVKQTAFTETTRTVETPDVIVTKMPGFDAYLIEPTNSPLAHLYIDEVLKTWWDIIEELVSELGDEDMTTQYYAWRDPELWIPNIMEDAYDLEDKMLKVFAEKPYKIYSQSWATTHGDFGTPIHLIKSMMVAHEGRYNYDTHSLLLALHEAGKLNEGEIE